MKVGFSLLIFIFSLKGYSCTFKELLDFQVSGLAEGIALKDCTGKIRLKDQDQICNCAKGNLGKLNFTPDQQSTLKALHEMSIEKAKLGLLNLSEEIYMLHSMGEPIESINLGPKCNSKQRLEAIKCLGAKNLVIGNRERSTRLIEIYNQLKNDSSANGPRLYPPRAKNSEKKSLFDRFKFNSEANNECSGEKPLTQKFAQDINNKLLNSKLLYLSQALDLSKFQNYKTLEDFLIVESSTAEGKESQDRANQLLEEIKSNPYYTHLIQSPSFIEDIKASNGDATKVQTALEKFQKLSVNQNEIKNKIQKKCDAVFESLEKAFCAEADDVKIPDLKPKQVKDLAKGELLETYDKTNVAHLMSVSHNLNNYYCGENKESNYSLVSETVAPSLPNTLADITNFDSGAYRLYNSTTLKMADKICKYLPPTMDKINKVVADCKKEKGLKTQDCVLYEATHAALEKTYKTKALQVKNDTIAKAKRDGIKDKAKIDQLVQSAIKNIDTNAIMEAYSDFSSAGKKKGNSDLINSFLGVVEPKTSAVAKIDKKDVIPSGASTELTPAELAIGGFSSNSSDNDIKATTYSELAQKSQEKEIDNFYDEVASRVKSFRKRQAAIPASAKISSSGQRSIPKELQRALKSPFPKPAPVKNESDDDYYELASNYGQPSDFEYSPETTTNNNFFENSDNTRNPVVADNPAQSEEARKQAEYNRALADAYQTKQEEARKAAAKASGKISDSPFKDRGLGTAGGTQFRGPASLGGGGGLSFSPEYLPLNPDTLKEDFKQLIENVAAEKQQGVEGGENSKHANMILDMLSLENKKAVTLKSTLNPKHEIQILKKKNGRLELKPSGNMADQEYAKFVNVVEKVVIGYSDPSYKNEFSKILKDLEYALKEGRVKPTVSGNATRLTDFK